MTTAHVLQQSSKGFSSSEPPSSPLGPPPKRIRGHRDSDSYNPSNESGDESEQSHYSQMKTRQKKKSGDRMWSGMRYPPTIFSILGELILRRWMKYLFNSREKLSRTWKSLLGVLAHYGLYVCSGGNLASNQSGFRKHLRRLQDSVLQAR